MRVFRGVFGRDFAVVGDARVNEIDETKLIDRNNRGPAIDPVLPGNPSIGVGY